AARGKSPLRRRLPTSVRRFPGAAGSRHDVRELAAILVDELRLRGGHRKQRKQVRTRLFGLRVTTEPYGFQHLFHCLAEAPLTRKHARQLDARAVIERIDLEL